MIDQEIPSATGAQTTGWFDSLTERFSLGALWEKIKGSKDIIIDVVLFGAFGILIGYLLKRYSSYFIALVFFIVTLALLQQFGVISVLFHWTRIFNLLGVRLVFSEQQAAMLVWELIKANIIPLICFIIGFLFGLKIG